MVNISLQVNRCLRGLSGGFCSNHSSKRSLELGSEFRISFLFTRSKQLELSEPSDFVGTCVLKHPHRISVKPCFPELPKPFRNTLEWFFSEITHLRWMDLPKSDISDFRFFEKSRCSNFLEFSQIFIFFGKRQQQYRDGPEGRSGSALHTP